MILEILSRGMLLLAMCFPVEPDSPQQSLNLGTNPSIVCRDVIIIGDFPAERTNFRKNFATANLSSTIWQC